MKAFKRYFVMVIGIFLTAASFNLLFLPNKLVYGGVSGISIIVSNLFPIDPTLFVTIVYIFLLMVSFILLGKEKTKGSIIGSILFPIFMKLTENIGNVITIETTDMLLIALFGGVIVGIGAGLTYKMGFTTGGSDIINQIVSKYCHISIGKAVLIVDGLIILSASFSFGFTKSMYAVIVLYLLSVIADKVILGISSSKAFYIITDEEDKIKEYLLKTIDNGVTIINGTGGFSGKKQIILMCILPTREYFVVKEVIRKIDPDAFFLITDAYEVYGGKEKKNKYDLLDNS